MKPLKVNRTFVVTQEFCEKLDILRRKTGEKYYYKVLENAIDAQLEQIKNSENPR